MLTAHPQLVQFRLRLRKVFKTEGMHPCVFRRIHVVLHVIHEDAFLRPAVIAVQDQAVDFRHGFDELVLKRQDAAVHIGQKIQAMPAFPQRLL